ncbi:uncharacterized protein LOC128608697 [Ictalurus furcatus]|uniref:uncharacterized protein LOC128608697 n=1 Tax=Ictalurus furcatus TaxID=66913 RepID=UPI0023509C11|nr:uncharacterized protein LOC128608697 [Ictalurus furcatus]
MEGRDSMSIHATVLKKGGRPLISRCTRCCKLYHCPFCETYVNKSASLLSFKNHVENHFRLAVQHDDFVIVKCNLGCRDDAHFHCCYCPATVIRKVQLVTHLQKCKLKLGRTDQEVDSPLIHNPSPTAQPSTVSTQTCPLPSIAKTLPTPLLTLTNSQSVTQMPPLSYPMSIHLPSAPVFALIFQSPPPISTLTAPLPQLLQTETSHPHPPLSVPASPLSVSTKISPSPTVTSTHIPPEPPAAHRPLSRPIRIKCNQCHMELNKKNLRVHIRRKHTDVK